MVLNLCLVLRVYSRTKFSCGHEAQNGNMCKVTVDYRAFKLSIERNPPEGLSSLYTNKTPAEAFTPPADEK